MRVRSTLQRVLEPIYADKPLVEHALRKLDGAVDLLKQTAVFSLPALARPDPRRIYVTLTALCNLRCKGCLYGVSQFMPGQQLPWPLVRDLLDDARALGIRNVRLYGGEPLLYRDLPKVVRHATEIGLHTWMTTNGILLRERFDALFDAGLRHLDFGFYGTGAEYDTYVRRNDRFRRLEEGISYVRDRYGKAVTIKMGWLLMRPTCSPEALRETWAFATRYDTPIYVNLFHYSLPYFTEGTESELKFDPADRAMVERVVDELLQLQQQSPHMFENSRIGLQSIPDWLIRGANMRVPCTERELIWVGADGTVQMCYVTFRLGNLHEKRLKELLFSPEHHRAARDSVALNCPNCHCSYDRRTNEHFATRRLYSTRTLRA